MEQTSSRYHSRLWAAGWKRYKEKVTGELQRNNNICKQQPGIKQSCARYLNNDFKHFGNLIEPDAVNVEASLLDGTTKLGVGGR